MTDQSSAKASKKSTMSSSEFSRRVNWWLSGSVTWLYLSWLSTGRQAWLPNDGTLGTSNRTINTKPYDWFVSYRYV